MISHVLILVRRPIVQTEACRVVSLFIQPNTSYGRSQVRPHRKQGKVNFHSSFTNPVYSVTIRRTLLSRNFSLLGRSVFKISNLTKFFLPATLLNTLLPEHFKTESCTQRALKLMSRHLQPHTKSVNSYKIEDISLGKQQFVVTTHTQFYRRYKKTSHRSSTDQQLSMLCFYENIRTSNFFFLWTQKFWQKVCL
jgi:hypothetical protein